ncbi:MAG: tetratricopeptide repeat protein [Pseudomonadota bacterium]
MISRIDIIKIIKIKALKFACAIGFYLQFITITISQAANMSGELVAIDGTQIHVRINETETTLAQPGDNASFNANLGGIDIDAGKGVVVSHDAQTIVIKITDGNPGLGMTATIDATGGERSVPTLGTINTPTPTNSAATNLNPVSSSVNKSPEENWEIFKKLSDSNPGEAISALKQAAEDGHYLAQFSLADKYNFGTKGITQDKKTALGWYMKSAKQNKGLSANFEIGSLLFDGDFNSGLESDPASALPWLQKSAKEGNAAGMQMLGRAYSEAYLRDIPFDYKKSRYWYEQAIARGSEYAQELLSALNQRIRKIDGVSYILPKGLKEHRETNRKGVYETDRNVLINLDFSLNRFAGYPVVRVHALKENKSPSQKVFFKHAKKAAKFPFGAGRRGNFELLSKPGINWRGIPYASFRFQRKKGGLHGTVNLLHNPKNNQVISVLALGYINQIDIVDLEAKRLMLTMWRE